MDWTTLIDRYGLPVALTFLVITTGVPKVVEFAQWAIEKLAPERLEKMRLQAEEEKRADEMLLEEKTAARDLDERRVIAQEQTAKALLLIDAHMMATEKSVQDQLTLLTTGLITANQSLAVLMDRTTQRRDNEKKPD